MSKAFCEPSYNLSLSATSQFKTISNQAAKAKIKSSTPWHVLCFLVYTITSMSKYQKILQVSPELVLELRENRIDQVLVPNKELGYYIPLTFYHYVPVWNSIRGIIEKYSEPIAVGCINARLDDLIKRRARDMLPFGTNKEETKTNLLRLYDSGKTLIIDADTARTYIPGTREDTNPINLLKRANELKKEGRIEEADKLKQQADAMFRSIKDLLDDDLEAE